MTTPTTPLLPVDAGYGPAEPETGRTDAPAWVRMIDRVLAVQRPAVLSHIRAVRRLHPDASPERIVRILELRYLTAVTTGGAAVGATSMIPAVGTAVTLGIAGAETLGFLEASALFAQSVAEVHGLPVTDPVRARALVMTMILGRSGTDLLRQLTGQALRTGPDRSSFWGEMITAGLPQIVVGPVADELKKRFLRSFAKNQGTTLIGKAVPFGIGAAIGGVGNNMAGREVVRSARTAFGPAPLAFAEELDVRRGGARERSRIGGIRSRLALPRRRAVEAETDQ